MQLVVCHAEQSCDWNRRPIKGTLVGVVSVFAQSAELQAAVYTLLYKLPWSTTQHCIHYIWLNKTGRTKQTKKQKQYGAFAVLYVKMIHVWVFIFKWHNFWPINVCMIYCTCSKHRLHFECEYSKPLELWGEKKNIQEDKNMMSFSSSYLKSKCTSWASFKSGVEKEYLYGLFCSSCQWDTPWAKQESGPVRAISEPAQRAPGRPHPGL